jgi:C-terminal processing protease CtpA/Prc
MKVRLLHIIILGLFSLYANAWDAIYYEPLILTTLYDIQKDVAVYSNKDIIHFPDGLVFPLSDNNKGYNILKYRKLNSTVAYKINIDRKVYFWMKDFNNTVLCKKDTTLLTLYFYQQNIKNVYIYIHTQHTNKWLKKEIVCQFEGYQIPTQIKLSDFFEEYTASEQIDRLLLIAEPIDLNKKVIFAPNCLSITEEVLVEKKCQHPFLDKLFNRQGNCDSLFKFNCLLRNTDGEGRIILCTKDTYNQDEYFRPDIHFKKEIADENEVLFIQRIIALALQEYPFYQERGLNKENIIEKFSQLVAKYDNMLEENEEGLLIEISSFIKKELNDAHFILTPNFHKIKSLYSPVRLYEISNKIVVAAVFDSTYTNKIPLGSEVLTINNVAIEYIIDSLRMQQYGLPERKRSRAIAIVLDRQVGDSVMITFKNRDNNVIETCSIFYNKKITIPSNFRPHHYLFEIINDVAYFNIKRMDGDVFLRFINHLNQIQNSKGLILDLRNNGGGSSTDGMSLFSIFIDKPMVYCHTAFSQKDNRMESIVLQPNNDIHFSSDFPIVLLGDENTACASEQFIQAMQQLDNCYFISHSRTSGSLQNRYNFHFPDRTSLALDCLSEKIYSNKMSIIECKGIQPDIWIQSTKVEDLAPYVDLLKSAAINVIKSKHYSK